MNNDGLGDRMKKYEQAYNHIYPARLPLFVRLDGVHFHSNVKRWQCKKPFDENLVDAMMFTAKILCENISGTQVAYVESDEITLLIRDDMDVHTQPWYDKEVNKIVSVAASKATNAFNHKYHTLGGYKREEDFGTTEDHVDPIPLNLMAEFDCRGWVVPEQEINNTFLWRQQDCTRNSVQMLARAHFSHKQLEKKNNNELQDMLMLEKGINWNNLATHLKRGACVIKKDVQKKVPKRNEKGKIIKGEYEDILRPAWVVDKEIPIFSKDPSYINRFARIKE